MLPGGVFLELYLRGILVELGRDSEVAKADVALTGGEEEDVTALGMVLYVGDDLGKLFNVDRLQVYDLVG
jgi:hypothetical protein